MVAELPPLTDVLVMDPQILAIANQTVFRQFTFAYGELELPCDPDLLEEQVALLVRLLRSLSQYPPESEIQAWREKLAAKLAAGAAAPTVQRLVLRYEPYADFIGLTAGLQLGFRLREGADSPVVQRPHTETEPAARLAEKTLTLGQLEMPALPSLLDQHLWQIEGLLKALGLQITEQEVESWRAAIAPTLERWFAESPNTYLRVNYHLTEPVLGLHSGVRIDLSRTARSINDMYRAWTLTREGPLFGSHADAKVLAVAAQLGDPRAAPVLDVGAGTGRNSLALAQRGFPVTAVEVADVLGDQLAATAQADHLPIQLIRSDILAPDLALPAEHYQLIFLSEVIASHFHSVAQVQQLLGRLCAAIAPGGYLLFNLFLSEPDYDPRPPTRELSHFCWSAIFTPTELREMTAGLPLQLVSDEAALAYEQAHLPAEAFPPTSWYVNWASGRNLFPISAQPPMELHWVLFQKR